MEKRDIKASAVIGALVGILIQPVIDNIAKGSPLLTNALGGGMLTPPSRLSIFLFFTFFAPSALWIAHWLARVWSVLYQFAKFAAVGTLNSFINFGILNFQSLITGTNSGPLIPLFATIAFLAATTNSFFWNKYWTFGSRGTPGSKEAPKFYLIAMGGWGLDVAAVSLVVNYLHPAAGISPQLWLNIGGLCGVAASFLWNFIGYKYLVFKQPETI